jgi:hypothetical protein
MCPQQVPKACICWLRYFLLLVAVFAYGGTTAGARFLEFNSAEGENEITQEATDTRRRDLARKKHFRDRRGREIEELILEKRERPSHLRQVRTAGEVSPVIQYFRAHTPPRAPPLSV